jgi:hypothetical protein
LWEQFNYIFWKQVTLPIKARLNGCKLLFCADYFVPYFHLGFKSIPVFFDAFFWEYPAHYNKYWLWVFNTIGIGAAKKSSAIVTNLTDLSYNLILGNLGTNISVKVSQEKPFKVYGGDFDTNSIWDAISSNYWGEVEYPVHAFDDLRRQLPSLRKKFQTFSAFSNAKISDILTESDIKNSMIRKAANAQSLVLINQGNFKFTWVALPQEAQWAPVNDILFLDINADGLEDLITVGNDYGIESFTGQYDASYGSVLLNIGKGHFKNIPSNKSGLWILGDAKSIIPIDFKGKKKKIIIARNNQELQFYSIIK